LEKPRSEGGLSKRHAAGKARTVKQAVKGNGIGDSQGRKAWGKAAKGKGKDAGQSKKRFASYRLPLAPGAGIPDLGRALAEAFRLPSKNYF
jgi:hypothetical protein